MNKPIKISIISTLVFIAAYIALQFIAPTVLIQKAIHLTFNTPARVDVVFYKNLRYLIILGIALTLFFLLKKSIYWEKLASSFISGLNKLTSLFTLKILFGISIVYLIVLFYIAITHYDLGFDEAWYIYYSKNFAATGMMFSDDNGKIVIVDTITMLPYCLLSLINFYTGLTSVVDFKILSSALSIITLVILFVITEKFYNRKIAIISLFVLIAQPGFGFMASSYFGEIAQASFLFGGLYYWLKDDSPPDGKKMFLISLLFAFAIHTKFQLLFILVISLIILHFTDKNTRAAKVLLYTLLFTAIIIVIRTIPSLVHDPKLLRHQLIITDLIASGPNTLGPAFVFDKMQLYNRFFQLPVLLVTLGIFYFYMKTVFERFLFLFVSVTALWWIFLYPYATYRTPFMALIPLSIIIAILITKLFEKSDGKKSMVAKYIPAAAVIIFMMYGFSANIIYAYIGYNDGVQFDLYGYKNRLFSKVEYDNSQKEFYGELKTLVRTGDTLYRGSFVSNCYVENPVASFYNLKESLQTTPGEKHLLITREYFPLGLEEGRRQMLDSLNANWKLVLKKGDYEMYVVKK